MCHGRAERQKRLLRRHLRQVVRRTHKRSAGHIPVRTQTYVIRAATSPVAAFFVASTIFKILAFPCLLNLKLRANSESSTHIDANNFFDRQNHFLVKDTVLAKSQKLCLRLFSLLKNKPMCLTRIRTTATSTPKEISVVRAFKPDGPLLLAKW